MTKVKAANLQAWLEEQMRKREPRARRSVRLTGLRTEALERQGYVRVTWRDSAPLTIGKVHARIGHACSLLDHVLQDARSMAWCPVWAAGLFDGSIGPREREALVRRLVASRELRNAIASTYRVGGKQAATAALRSDITR